MGRDTGRTGSAAIIASMRSQSRPSAASPAADTLRAIRTVLFFDICNQNLRFGTFKRDRAQHLTKPHAIAKQ